MNALRLLPALLLVLPLSAVAQWTSALHDTGVVQFEVFDNGKLGAFADEAGTPVGWGFVFNDENGLYEGAFLVGQSFEQVSGDLYDFPDLEWVTVEPVSPVTPPHGFDEAYEAVYSDAGAPTPIGLEVTQRSFIGNGDPFAFVEFALENTSGSDLEDLYVGVFADWDVGPWFAQNMWGLDEEVQLAYCWDPTVTNPNYYGVVALDPPGGDHAVSGFCFDALPGDPILFGCMTVIHTPPHGSDRRTVLAVGPFDIPAGEAVSVPFAFVGGADEADILANAETAQCTLTSECPAPSEPTPSSLGVTLRAAYPNPARDASTLHFTLDRPMPIRLSILDALGREVAVLVDEAQAAGEHRVTWEAAGLPAGVYLVRLEAGGALLSRRVAVSR